MAVAKVILNGNTLIDTTQKTVTAGSMLDGVTALKNDGTDITGSITSKTSSDLTASGDTVTAPAGYYASSASKAVASGSATTPATTITANPSISVSSGGLITASVSASQSVTPTVSAGYVSSGTAGTVSVSGSNTSQLTTQAAQTIHPSATDQTIASQRFLTGTQTVKGVLLTNLSAGNIKKDVVVKVGDSTDDDCVTSVTGTYEGGGGGSTVVDLSQNWETENQSLISNFASGTEYAFKAIKIDNTVYFSFLAYWEDPVDPFYEGSTDISLSCASFGDSWGASKEAIGFMSSEEIVYPVSAETYFDKSTSFPRHLFLTAYVPSGLSGNGLLYVSFFGHADVA